MLGFVVAIGAGLLTPYLTDPLARPLAKALRVYMPVKDGELILLSFMLAMLGAAMLGQMLSSGTPFWIVAGGSIGYFGKRIIAAVQAVAEKRRRGSGS